MLQYVRSCCNSFEIEMHCTANLKNKSESEPYLALRNPCRALCVGHLEPEVLVACVARRCNNNWIMLSLINAQ